MRVATLTIKGTLKWDIEKDGIKLSAKYIMVEEYGTLEVGTEDAPMEKKATIYIETPWENWDPKGDNEGKVGWHHGTFGTRFLGGHYGSNIIIHGRKLERTWTLLAADAQKEATTLRLKVRNQVANVSLTSVFSMIHD